MPPTLDPPDAAPHARRPAGRAVGLLIGSLLVAAGALLWWRRGEAVFTDTVLASLAWCF